MPKKYASSFDNVDEAIRAMGERVITCPECARYFVPWRVDQQRCSTTCSRKFWNRSTTRGSALLPIAMEWRSTRGKAKDKLNKMCFMLDGWNSDDRERNKKYEDAVAVLRERRKKATK